LNFWYTLHVGSAEVLLTVLDSFLELMALKQGFHSLADMEDGVAAALLHLSSGVRCDLLPVEVGLELELFNHALVVLGIVHQLPICRVKRVVRLLLDSLVKC
jgi:hypothetical protein